VLLLERLSRSATSQYVLKISAVRCSQASTTSDLRAIVPPTEHCSARSSARSSAGSASTTSRPPNRFLDETTVLGRIGCADQKGSVELSAAATILGFIAQGQRRWLSRTDNLFVGDPPFLYKETGKWPSHEERRGTRVSLKIDIAAQGVSEPLRCDGETIVVNRHGALKRTFGDCRFPQMIGTKAPADASWDSAAKAITSNAQINAGRRTSARTAPIHQLQPRNLKTMRNALRLSFVLLTAIPALAGRTQIINASCEDAITEAEVLAAQRKWWPDRPDPKAPVLNIRTHGNFAKQALLPLGRIWSHEKVGELAFEEREKSCRVNSNGHPADVVLSDLSKLEFTAPAAAADPASTLTSPQRKNVQGTTDKTPEKCQEGTYWGQNANGEPICVWSR